MLAVSGHDNGRWGRHSEDDGRISGKAREKASGVEARSQLLAI